MAPRSGRPAGGADRGGRRVRTRNSVAAGAVAAVVVLAGCSGAVVKSTVGPGSTFCTDLGTFATQSALIADGASFSRAQFLQAMPPIHALVVKLAGEAPSADTVNGKSLKADLTTVASVTADMITAVQAATSDAGVKPALAQVNAKEGQALTVAVGRVDSYTGKCHLSTTTTTSVPATTTTLGPVGPTVASTPSTT